MGIRWVVQSNLINASDHDRMIDVCRKHGYEHESLKVTPFTDDLPDIPDDMPTVFYGGTNFINNVHLSKRWKPGAFFGDTFSYCRYYEGFGANMLGEPTFTTLREFSSSHREDSAQFFVRPDADLKMFAGEVMRFGDVVRWERNLRHGVDCSKHPGLTPDTKIVVSPPYAISHEWRLFVVGGRVSSGSHYRSKHNLDIREELPDAVVRFAEQRTQEWSPADVFVMDVGESAGNLYVIECNCFNSAGFYSSDVEKIMTDVSEAVIHRFQMVYSKCTCPCSSIG